MDEWIPVSKRLPRKDEYGKIFVTYSHQIGGARWPIVILAHCSDLMGTTKPCFHIGEVGKENFQNITEHVTAWMRWNGYRSSLPKPYDGLSMYCNVALLDIASTYPDRKTYLRNDMLNNPSKRKESPSGSMVD